ncbi:MAG: hypothetical protein PUD95_01505 [Succinatimonas sp.]|nr:hypothetical protein [Succinatimonas sp.]MDD6754727.1 hypothetical protein [Succinatimonas sp.]
MKLSDTYSALIVLVVMAEIYLKIIFKLKAGSLQTSFKISATKVQDHCKSILNSVQTYKKITANFVVLTINASNYNSPNFYCV